jgi:uncharacterized protein YjbI with pentapeptide repeats
MIGLKFEECNSFLMAFSFNHCVLNFSSFYQLNLKNTAFSECKLIEVDFTTANLTEASFNACNLEKAVFENTILEKTDLRNAFNFSIDPERNRLKKAKFSKENVEGLLSKYDILIT